MRYYETENKALTIVEFNDDYSNLPLKIKLRGYINYPFSSHPHNMTCMTNTLWSSKKYDTKVHMYTNWKKNS